MQWFADLRIAYKIAIVPLALGLLLVALGVVSTVSLRSIASRVEVVTQDLGPSMDQLTKVTDAMARLQLSVRQFARNGDSAAEQQFAALDQRMSAALDQADGRLQDAERQRLLGEIRRLHGDYRRLFREQLVPLSQQREQLMSAELNVHGPAVEKILTSVLENAQQDFNLDAVFYASAGMRHLLLGSQYLYQFLQENQPEQAQAFERELENAQSMMSVLRDRSSSDSTKSKLQAALASLDLYKIAAAKLVKLVTAHNQAVQAMDKIDPQIADLAQQLQSSIMTAMQDAAVAAEETVVEVNQLFWGVVLAAVLLTAVIFSLLGFVNAVFAKNFDQIRVGDSVVARYLQALTLELKKTKGVAGASVAEEAMKAGDDPRAPIEARMSLARFLVGSGLNYEAIGVLNALVAKGLVKIENFSQNQNKFGYVYLLTPSGIAEKASRSE